MSVPPHENQLGGRSLSELADDVVAFRDARDWKQFHTPRDLAISLLLEASELLEHTQWADGDDLHRRLAGRRESVGEESADVLYYTLLLAHDLDVDLEAAFCARMHKNEAKYPVETARVTSKKHTKLSVTAL